MRHKDFDLNTFHPGWRWMKTDPTDWAKQISFTGVQQANWFVDVDGDGDGLVDMIEDRCAATPDSDLEPATAARTRGYPASKTDGRPMNGTG